MLTISRCCFRDERIYVREKCGNSFRAGVLEEGRRGSGVSRGLMRGGGGSEEEVIPRGKRIYCRGRKLGWLCRGMVFCVIRTLRDSRTDFCCTIFRSIRGKFKWKLESIFKAIDTFFYSMILLKNEEIFIYALKPNSRYFFVFYIADPKMKEYWKNFILSMNILKKVPRLYQ